MNAFESDIGTQPRKNLSVKTGFPSEHLQTRIRIFVRPYIGLNRYKKVKSEGCGQGGGLEEFYEELKDSSSLTMALCSPSAADESGV
jgi:hypothetical protein